LQRQQHPELLPLFFIYIGRTAHSRFKFSFYSHKNSVCNTKKQPEVATFLSSIALGIIDEGSMLHKLRYEALCRTLKDLVSGEDKTKKLGGKIILVSGDFVNYYR